MTVMTTFNKNWALRANRGVVVLAAPLQLVVVGCKKNVENFSYFYLEKGKEKHTFAASLN